MQATPDLHPMQLPKGGSGRVSVVVVMEAYRVYRKLYGEQPNLVTGNCRGGFGVGELVCLLYARTFPESEWRSRFDEAIEEMKCD